MKGSLPSFRHLCFLEVNYSYRIIRNVSILLIEYTIACCDELGCCCSIHNLKPDGFNCRSTSETSLSLSTVRENMTRTKRSIPNTTGNNTEWQELVPLLVCNHELFHLWREDFPLYSHSINNNPFLIMICQDKRY